ncbi:MAG: hypothetical protein IPI06_14670 [Gammaproteobacteria bacterium]|nr:hypothetical protein [Gammaproteobacteria bacterium]
MNIRLPLALLGFALAGVAVARPPELKTVDLAVEAPAHSVVLPSGVDSALVTAPCAGCAPKSLRATAATGYFVNEQRVSLAELQTAIAGKPETMLTVLYSLKTGELLSVTAALPVRSTRR